MTKEQLEKEFKQAIKAFERLEMIQKALEGNSQAIEDERGRILINIKMLRDRLKVLKH